MEVTMKEVDKVRRKTNEEHYTIGGGGVTADATTKAHFTAALCYQLRGYSMSCVSC
jgi:hypothetical protein